MVEMPDNILSGLVESPQQVLIIAVVLIEKEGEFLRLPALVGFPTGWLLRFALL